MAIMLATPMAYAGGPLTPHQSWALEYASVVGTSYYAEPFPADYHFERTLEAVLITESSLCRHKHGIDHRAYGCGQLHRAAAHVVDDAKLSVRTLKRNDALNIRLAARYLSYCLRQMTSWARGVVCYNKGPNHTRTMTDAQVATDSYLQNVRLRMQEAEQLTASSN
ncbi:MAG: transglycosylase SLT domain-containing protein [Gammaproteobacteria bacterium]|nr:transglycosylase SLT domain-containing protein [Gammaproteobacteria bacterium]